jgi:hypothetical protein
LLEDFCAGDGLAVFQDRASDLRKKHETAQRTHGIPRETSNEHNQHQRTGLVSAANPNRNPTPPCVSPHISPAQFMDEILAGT